MRIEDTTNKVPDVGYMYICTYIQLHMYLLFICTYIHICILYSLSLSLSLSRAHTHTTHVCIHEQAYINGHTNTHSLPNSLRAPPSLLHPPSKTSLLRILIRLVHLIINVIPLLLTIVSRVILLIIIIVVVAVGTFSRILKQLANSIVACIMFVLVSTLDLTFSLHIVYARPCLDLGPSLLSSMVA